MSPDPVFVDTWGWMALGHRRDPSHSEIRRFHHELREQHVPVYTSDYVLDEVITLLFRRELSSEAVRFTEGLFTAAALGHMVVERVTSDRFAAAWELRRQFQDKTTHLVYRSDINGDYAGARDPSGAHGG